MSDNDLFLLTIVAVLVSSASAILVNAISSGGNTYARTVILTSILAQLILAATVFAAALLGFWTASKPGLSQALTVTVANGSGLAVWGIVPALLGSWLGYRNGRATYAKGTGRADHSSVNEAAPWFRFTTTKLIVMVTLGAVGVVWIQSQINAVGQRESIIKARGIGWSLSTQNPPIIPWTWSLLGARPFNLITMDNDVFTEQDALRYRATFPEADVVLGSPEYFRDITNRSKLTRRYRSPPEIDPKSWAHAARR